MSKKKTQRNFKKITTDPQTREIYRRVIHSFKILAGGKNHKITLPTPSEEKK